MITETLQVELGNEIINENGITAECQVYDVINQPDVVFKLFHNSYTIEKIMQSIMLNKKYAEFNLAPQVYGDIIQINDRYGYITERIIPLSSAIIDGEQIKKLARKLGIDKDHEGELYHNCGLTKNGDFVLYDWGTFSLSILKMIE